MKTRQRAYIFLIMTFGIAILVYSIVGFKSELSTMPTFLDYADWVIMLILFSLCRGLPVYIAKDKSIEISFVPVVASVMMYGVHLTIILFFLSTFLMFSYDRSTGKIGHQLMELPVKELFNTSNIIIAILIGGQPLMALGGYGDSFSFPYSILPATVFAIVTIIFNFILFVFYFVSAGEEKFFKMVSNTIPGILPNVLSTIPIGIFIAVLLNFENGSFFVLLFILPLLLARYSFKLYWDSYSMHMRTITALTRAIDAKDSYTRGHSERVACLAERIARYMGLPKKMVSDIQIAALIHDIGKIGIEDSILNKPGRLSSEEFEQIKKHPVIGSEIIEEIRFSKTVVDAVLYHHCNFDGSGYPCDDSIPLVQPLPAAILAIADAYDAMTTDRPYRKRLADEEALQILLDNSGTQFHPDVVKAFCKMPKKTRFSYNSVSP
jgi:putative nucleotidyltransferase with HDIG domain